MTKRGRLLAVVGKPNAYPAPISPRDATSWRGRGAVYGSPVASAQLFPPAHGLVIAPGLSSEMLLGLASPFSDVAVHQRVVDM